MAYVIQDIDNGKYLKHTGDHGDDHPYEDVDATDEAEQYTSFEHVTYVVFWYCSVYRNYRVIDTETGLSYIKDQERRFKIETH